VVARRAGAVPLTEGWGKVRPARWLAKAAPHLVFHARGRMLEGLTADRFALLGALAAHARAHLPVAVVAYDHDSHAAAADPAHVHILMEDRPLYAPTAFHCVPSYLHGFWYFDEVATRNNSTGRLARFDPRAVAGPFAEGFAARLADRFIRQNRSKFDQPPRGQPVPDGCLAFFAQDFRPPRHHRNHLSVPQMLDALIAARGDRPVVIRPHPNQKPDEIAALTDRCGPGITVSGASVHDILAACSCAVTVTSACAFEGFLHGKPAVLGGQTDFAQNAVTLTNPARMAEALAAALARDWPHARYLTWYLTRVCVQDRLADLPEVLARMHRKGIAWADPGTGFY
jgi:hypothetical protein